MPFDNIQVKKKKKCINKMKMIKCLTQKQHNQTFYKVEFKPVFENALKMLNRNKNTS